jgi:hypothetical protein
VLCKVDIVGERVTSDERERERKEGKCEEINEMDEGQRVRF